MLLGHGGGMAAFGADRGGTVAGCISGRSGFGGCLAGCIRLCGIRCLGRRVLRGVTGGGCRSSGVHGRCTIRCRVGSGSIPHLARSGCVLGSRRGRLGLPVAGVGFVVAALDVQIFIHEDAVVGQRLLGCPVGRHLPQAAHGALDIGLDPLGAAGITESRVLAARCNPEAEHHFVRRTASLNDELQLAAVIRSPR